MEGFMPKWLRDWLLRLLPSHHSAGDNATHVGKVSGDFAANNVTMHVTQNFYSAQVESQPAANTTANTEQREVLSVLRQLPEDAKERVFKHMLKKYGTKMVIEVEAAELKNLKRYMEVTLKNEYAAKQRKSACNEST